MALEETLLSLLGFRSGSNAGAGLEHAPFNSSVEISKSGDVSCETNASKPGAVVAKPKSSMSKQEVARICAMTAVGAGRSAASLVNDGINDRALDESRSTNAEARVQRGDALATAEQARVLTCEVTADIRAAAGVATASITVVERLQLSSASMTSSNGSVHFNLLPIGQHCPSAQVVTNAEQSSLQVDIAPAFSTYSSVPLDVRSESRAEEAVISGVSQDSTLIVTLDSAHVACGDASDSLMARSCSPAAVGSDNANSATPPSLSVPLLHSGGAAIVTVSRRYVYNLLNDGHMLAFALPLRAVDVIDAEATSASGGGSWLSGWRSGGPQPLQAKPVNSRVTSLACTVRLGTDASGNAASGLADVTSPTHDLLLGGLGIGCDVSTITLPSTALSGSQNSSSSSSSSSSPGVFVAMLEPANVAMRWRGLRGSRASVNGRMLPPGVADAMERLLDRNSTSSSRAPPQLLTTSPSAASLASSITAGSSSTTTTPTASSSSFSSSSSVPASSSLMTSAPPPSAALPSHSTQHLHLSLSSLPRHIAVVMDGNGRWAKARGLARSAGHVAGVEAIHRLIRACRRLRVGYLTLYAFSAQNWSRPPEEVGALMRLLGEFVAVDCEELVANGLRLRVTGDVAALPAPARAGLERLVWASRANTGLTLILALSYGGREEIAAAAAAAGRAACLGLLPGGAAALSHPSCLSAFLPHPDVPDPDLLVRTSGEVRVSNFLLWGIAYTELHVTPALWPDFGEAHLLAALADYARRERRFGKTSAQVTSEQQQQQHAVVASSSPSSCAPLPVVAVNGVPLSRGQLRALRRACGAANSYGLSAEDMVTTGEGEDCQDDSDGGKEGGSGHGWSSSSWLGSWALIMLPAWMSGRPSWSFGVARAPNFQVFTSTSDNQQPADVRLGAGSDESSSKQKHKRKRDKGQHRAEAAAVTSPSSSSSPSSSWPLLALAAVALPLLVIATSMSTALSATAAVAPPLHRNLAPSNQLMPHLPLSRGATSGPASHSGGHGACGGSGSGSAAAGSLTPTCPSSIAAGHPPPPPHEGAFAYASSSSSATGGRLDWPAGEERALLPLHLGDQQQQPSSGACGASSGGAGSSMAPPHSSATGVSTVSAVGGQPRQPGSAIAAGAAVAAGGGIGGGVGHGHGGWDQGPAASAGLSGSAGGS